MTTPININNASLDELKGITGISDRRAQKIIKLREEKGFPLKREDLKLMSDILYLVLNQHSFCSILLKLGLH
jgi:competence ComEA-like helix-hairpin-helix protein